MVEVWFLGRLLVDPLRYQVGWTGGGDMEESQPTAVAE